MFFVERARTTASKGSSAGSKGRGKGRGKDTDSKPTADGFKKGLPAVGLPLIQRNGEVPLLPSATEFSKPKAKRVAPANRNKKRKLSPTAQGAQKTKVGVK